MRVDQPIDVMGKFWLPEQSEEDGVTGRLIIEDGCDIRLKLFGRFKDFNDLKCYNENQIFNVVGIIGTNFAVTLENCFITAAPNTGAKLIEIPVCAGMALLDRNTFHTVPFQINQMCFQLEGLETWLHYQDFNIKKNLKIEPYSFTWGNKQSVALGDHEDAKLELVFKADYSSDENIKTVFKYPFFRISTSKPQNFDNFIKIANDLTSFFSFACNNITTIKNVKIFFGDSKTQSGTQIYYGSKFSVEKAPNFTLNNFLISYESVQHRLKSLIQNYFLLLSEIKHGLILFHSTQIHKRILLESEFLVIAQALENLPRIEYAKKYPTKKLQTKNKFELCKYLKNTYSPIKHIIGDKKFDELMKKVAHTRNYNSHPGIKVLPNTEFGNDLLQLFYQAQAIFKLMVLFKIGFSLAEIEDIIANCYPLKQQLK